MIKNIKIICVLFFIAIILISCEKPNETVNVNINEIYSEIEQSVGLPEFISIDKTDVTEYYGLNPNDFDEIFIQMCLISINADEIVICKATDAESLQRLEQGFNNYLENRRNVFMSYAPLEHEKLKNTKVKTFDFYVYYAVSDDVKIIDDIFSKYFK